MSGMAITIPPSFAMRTVETFGVRGQAWLRDLPTIVSDLAHQWGLTTGEPFTLSYDYVIAVHLPAGTEAVLKIGVSDDQSYRAIAALRHYDGDGMCRLLESDVSRNAMLLERLQPGEMLSKLAQSDDDAATHIGAELMRALWRPVPDHATFRPIAEWFNDAFSGHRAAYGGAGPLPESLFAYAERLATDLLHSTSNDVLLHGDLHHYNILAANRAPWLAIDPKGMYGDPGYEVGPFLLNPHLGGVELSRNRLSRRLDILAEHLDYDRERLRDWGIAHAVLSACWSAEDHGRGWEAAIEAGEVLRRPPAL